MPMDGLTLGFAQRELNALLAGGRVDKITQPEKDMLILLIRSQGENHRLVLCASPNNARAHITKEQYVNPMEPPMFCMLMRKHLQGGHVVGITQSGGDRVLHVDIESPDELGVMRRKTLVLEIMGRHSNLIAVDDSGRIIDGIRHVNGDMSRIREVLPGIAYISPPAQDKLDPMQLDTETLKNRLADASGPLDKALAGIISGLSGVAAGEIVLRIAGDAKAPAEEQDGGMLAGRIATLFAKLPAFGPPVLLKDALGIVRDMFPFPYRSYDEGLQEPCANISQALDRFFSARDLQERVSQKSASLHRLLKNHIERCERKLAMQTQELSDSARMEEYRIMGELINANLYRLEKGQETAVVDNYYDPEGGTMEIPLDLQLTPAQNAQRYFKRYQKARSAREVAAQQMELTKKELAFLEGAFDDLGKSETESDLMEIRIELQNAGYVRASHNRKQMRQLPKSKPYRYMSSDGIEIVVGKNSLQNERITAAAKGEEMWLHAKDMPGSHVVVKAEGDIPDRTLEEAAKLAAYYSKGASSAGVPVDYTRRKHVKKPGGSPTGFVIYTHQKTAYITVTKEDILRISQINEE